MARPYPANSLPLALSQGDPSGIGPELTLKAWLKTHEDPDVPPFLAVADLGAPRRHRARLGLKCSDQNRWRCRGRVGVSPRIAGACLGSCRLLESRASPDVRDAAGTIASIETCVRLIRAESGFGRRHQSHRQGTLLSRTLSLSRPHGVFGGAGRTLFRHQGRGRDADLVTEILCRPRHDSYSACACAVAC